MKITETNPENVESFTSKITDMTINGPFRGLMNLVINSVCAGYRRFNKVKALTLSDADIHLNPKLVVNKNINRCVIVGSYSKSGVIPDYVVYYLRALSQVCDHIVLVCDNPLSDNSELSKIENLVNCAVFLRHGRFDFGSWNLGLEYLRKYDLLNRCNELLFTNDSCYGPVYPLKDVFESMSEKDCDFWGLSDNVDGTYHIQSFFMLFKKNVFMDDIFTKFFEQLPVKMDWAAAVNSGELRLTKTLQQKFTPGVYRAGLCNNFRGIMGGNHNSTLWPEYSIDNQIPLIKVKALNGQYGFELEDGISDVMWKINDRNPELYSEIVRDIKARDVLEPRRLMFDTTAHNAVEVMREKDVVSFDIFDTLLIRPFVNPVDLFKQMSEVYHETEFYNLRVAAESEVRKNTKNHEVTLDEIYKFMPEKYHKYKDIELEFEFRALHPNPQGVRLYEQALSLNKTIICISDMYLPSSFLMKVLRRNGFDKVQNVYVSCEYRETKGEGTLFDCVLDELSLEKSKVIHFGDNPISDCKVPNSKGIDAYQIMKYLDRFKNNPANQKYSEFYDRSKSLSASMHIALCAEHRACASADYGFWEDMGYCIAGPLVLSYVDFITDACQRNDIDKMFFVARDGYILEKVYQQFFSQRYNVAHEYVYLTRHTGLTAFLDYFGEPTYLKSILSAYLNKIPGLKIHDSFKENEAEFMKHRAELMTAAQINKENLENYLVSKAGDSKSIAIIDMTTGLMSSMRFAKKVLSDRIKLGVFTGTFKTNPDMNYETFATNHVTGQEDSALKISELLISAPEPPILAVDEHGNPVYGQSIGVRLDVFDNIEKGIFDYCRDMIKYSVGRTGFMNFGEWLDLAKSYVRCCNDADLLALDNVYDTPTSDNCSECMKVSDYFRKVKTMF